MTVASRLRILAIGAMAALASCGGSDSPSGAAVSQAPQAASARVQPPAEVPEALLFAWSAGFEGDAEWTRSADGTYLVAWQPVGGAIPEAEPFDVRVAVARVDRAPLGAGASIAFDAEMPHHGHGMNLVPTCSPGAEPGMFSVGGVLLHMPGRWVIAVDTVEDGVLERAQWNVEIE